MKSESCTNASIYKDLEVMCNYRRLKFTRRFNNLPTLQTEDVAQHSFFTTILAMTMAEEYNLSVQKHNLEVHPYDVENAWDEVDVNLVMRQALLHDIEEAFTSDIPWNVKHHDDDTHRTILDATRSKMESIYQDCTKVMRDQMMVNFTAKFGLEGKFVAIADMMECAWNCHQEEQLGNRYLTGMKFKALKVINELEFSKVLKEASPIFNSMMKMMSGKTLYCASDTMNLD